MRWGLITLLVSAAPAAAWAQAQSADVYTLGELQVTARDREGSMIGGAVVGGEDLRRFDKGSLDRALDLAPGTTGGNSGGSRNERLVFVRGFDRFQTTLSVDGVRIFLPADNRIDFARFLTADLSEIQVSKGYVSVLDGPGSLGGAINLVTRKPTEVLEGEVGAPPASTAMEPPMAMSPRRGSGPSGTCSTPNSAAPSPSGTTSPCRTTSSPRPWRTAVSGSIRIPATGGSTPNSA